MESLAILVTFMLLTEILFGLLVIIFAALARFRGRFRRTAFVLIVLLAIETGWALWILPAFGFPSLVALALSAGLYWIPKGLFTKSRRS